MGLWDDTAYLIDIYSSGKSTFENSHLFCWVGDKAGYQLDYL